MSTPTIIIFTGSGNYREASKINLYRHNDGDPVTQLRVLAKIIRQAATMAHEYATEYPHIGERCRITPSTLAGLYIGETTTTCGMVASFVDEEANFGEYIYTVNVDTSEISVTDDDENPVDPYTYIDRLREECQDQHRGSIEESIELLADMDYTVFPRHDEVGNS